MQSFTGFIICVPDENLHKTLVKVWRAVSGISPLFKSQSISAIRAHYPPITPKVIINTPSDAMKKLIGHHSIVIATNVEDRTIAANLAKSMFEEAGYQAVAHIDPEPEFPPGFLSMVSIPALEGIALMFWPLDGQVTPEVQNKLPKRTAWEDDI